MIHLFQHMDLDDNTHHTKGIVVGVVFVETNYYHDHGVPSSVVGTKQYHHFTRLL